MLFLLNTFPIRNINIADYYAYGYELYPEGTLMPESPTAPLITLDLPRRRSTQGRGIKILSPKNKFCWDCW